MTTLYKRIYGNISTSNNNSNSTLLEVNKTGSTTNKLNNSTINTRTESDDLHIAKKQKTGNKEGKQSLFTSYQKDNQESTTCNTTNTQDSNDNISRKKVKKINSIRNPYQDALDGFRPREFISEPELKTKKLPETKVNKKKSGQEGSLVNNVYPIKKVAEANIRKSHFLQFAENIYNELSKKHKFESTPIAWQKFSYIYNTSIINNLEGIDKSDVKSVFDRLDSETSYCMSKGDILTKLKNNLNNNKIMSVNKHKFEECNLIRHENFTDTEVENIKAIIIENKKINSNCYYNGEIVKLLEDIKMAVDADTLNNKFIDALSLVIFNAEPKTGLFLNTSKLVNYIPEYFFYLDWVKVQKKYDLDIVKKIVIEEIEQIQRIVYIYLKHDKDISFQKLEIILKEEIVKLRLIILKKLNTIAPGTARVDLYRLAGYYEYIHERYSSQITDRLQLFFILTFVLEYDGIFFLNIEDLLKSYDSGFFINKTMTDVINRMFSTPNISRNIIMSLIMTYDYLEQYISCSKSVEIYMIFPFRACVAIIIKNRHEENKQFYFISPVELLCFLYKRISEIIHQK